MPHPEPDSPQSRGWTPERRARHAAAMRRWSPWTKSTGPKTASGKARSSRNAYKHGERSIEVRLLRAVMVNQRRLHSGAAFIAKNATNELLDNRAYRMLDASLQDGLTLIGMLLLPPVMQKPCNLDPPAGKSLTL